MSGHPSVCFLWNGLPYKLWKRMMRSSARWQTGQNAGASLIFMRHSMAGRYTPFEL